MLVSLFTDASRCHETGAAGYGYWAKSARKRTYGGGSIRSVTSSVNQAEIISVCNGLHCAIQDGVIEAGDKVLIQNDNMHVVCAIQGQVKISADIKIVMNAILSICHKHNLEIEARHIKGHTTNKEARFKVNEMVDDIAKRGMKAKRASIRHGEHQRVVREKSSGNQAS